MGDDSHLIYASQGCAEIWNGSCKQSLPESRAKTCEQVLNRKAEWHFSHHRYHFSGEALRKVVGSVTEISMKDVLLHELKTISDMERMFLNEPMEKHTTFHIGGPADVLIIPNNLVEVCNILTLCRRYETPCYIIGNGSNLLVGDAGIRGVVLKFGKEFAQIQCENHRMHVQAGAMLSQVASVALKHSLTGMEFAAGIPGTIGGAVMMNAGAYGSEMKDIVLDVSVLAPDGQLFTLSGTDMEFRYRQSIAEKKHYIILEVTLELSLGTQENIRNRMQELIEVRRNKQPFEYPSAGSTFKRPEGYFAGKLIMDAGLSGYRIGDAQVSEKHCGFVINRGHATAKEIELLMQTVGKRVYEMFGVTLEPEVRKIGEFI